MKRDWTKPIQLTTRGGADAWAYVSRSGKSLKIYVRPLDEAGDPILPSPTIVNLRLSSLKGSGTK